MTEESDDEDFIATMAIRMYVVYVRECMHVCMCVCASHLPLLNWVPKKTNASLLKPPPNYVKWAVAVEETSESRTLPVQTHQLVVLILVYVLLQC